MGSELEENRDGVNLALCVFSCIVFFVTFLLVQHNMEIELTYSDFMGHKYFISIQTVYGVNLYHDLVSLTYKLFKRPLEQCMIFVTVFFQALYLAIIYFIINRELRDKYSNSVILFFVSTIVLGAAPVKFWVSMFYIGNMGMNTWHNPTSYAVKPFMVLCFYAYYRGLMFCESDKFSRTSRKFIIHWCILAFSGYFLMYSKVSGAQGLYPAILIYSFLWLACKDSKGKCFSRYRFLYILKFATAFIPSILLFIRINFNVSQTSQFVFSGFRLDTASLKGVLYALLFPLYVILISRKKVLENKMLIVSLISYTVSFIVFMCFREFRGEIDVTSHGNLGWALHYSLIIVMISSIIEFSKFQNYIKNEIGASSSWGGVLITANRQLFRDLKINFGYFLISYYLISGIVYILLILHRDTFYF